MRKILIVGDGWLTPLEIEKMLTALGYEAVGQTETDLEAAGMVRNLEPPLFL